MTRKALTRRTVLKSAAAAFAAPMMVPSSVLGLDGSAPPSQRVTMGFIGCGRQCYYKNIPLFVRTPGVQALAVCDVDAWRLDNAAKQVKAQYDSGRAKGAYTAVEKVVDYQDLLARDDIDAVMISTPDHWHVPMALAAIRAGKDVCCEKPTYTIEQGRVLSDTVAKHKAVSRRLIRPSGPTTQSIRDRSK